MEEERKVYKVLVGKPEGKRPVGRPRRRREDDEIDRKDADWIQLAQDTDLWRALVTAVKKLRVLARRS
jgi:hypothetical protein